MKKLIAILMMVLLMPNLVLADVGDFESYDSSWSSSDWGSDWGSSSWDSDWSDSSWNSSDYNSSYGSNWGYYDDGYYYDDDTGGGFLFFIILIVIIVILTSKRKMNSTSSNGIPRSTYPKNIHKPGYTRNPARSEAVANEIRKFDKYFNDEQFLARVKNIFVKLQTAWSERNWETIRPLESEALFEQHSNQLKGYIERKQINKIERICVNFAELMEFSQDNEKDILIVALNSSMIDYIINEETGMVLKGSKDNRLTNTYKLTFIRKKGIVTEEGTEKLNTTNCPNCGAPTTITSSGKCEFCGAVITIGAHDWVLGDMERM